MPLSTSQVTQATTQAVATTVRANGQIFSFDSAFTHAVVVNSGTSALSVSESGSDQPFDLLQSGTSVVPLANGKVWLGSRGDACSVTVTPATDARYRALVSAIAAPYQAFPIMDDTTGATITAGTPGASTLAKQYNYNSAVFRVSGALFTDDGSEYVGRLNDSSNSECPPYRVEFYTDAPAFEIQSIGDYYRLWVDGSAWQPGGGGTNNLLGTVRTYDISGVKWVKFTFSAGRKWRRIMFEVSRPTNGFVFKGARVDALSTISHPTHPLGPKTLVIGDSYTQSLKALGRFTGWAHDLGKLLGLNVYAQGVSSTDYAFPANRGFIDRVQLAADVAPELVIVSGSYNSALQGGATLAALQASETAYFTALKALIGSSVPIIQIGPWNPKGDDDIVSAALISADSISQGVAAAFGNGYVSPLTGKVYGPSGTLIATRGPWITGTGNAGSLAANGNGDLFTDADDIHPAPLSSAVPNGGGDHYIAIRAAEGIRLALGLRP